MNVLRTQTDLLRAEYERLYDDSAELFKKAVQEGNEQRINQNKAIMRFLDQRLKEDCGEQ